ncbi:Ionotropic receptor 175 [Frankliniella occidentalis]|nr:Ionotropic receptor 175 [Frankliniella occidentalis]
MEVLLVAFFLCCAVPGVRADLPVVDSAAPPEARSAAALLTPFMAPQKATLLVLGRARWTGAFVGELSADVPRVVSPRLSRSSSAFDLYVRTTTRQLDRLQYALIATHCVLFVPTDDLEELVLVMSIYSNIRRSIDIRVLFWTSATAPREEVLRRISSLNTWMGGRQHALALTAPNGSTTLYNMTCTSGACCSREMILLETDKWSPAEQRWRLGVTPFHKFCSGHRLTGKRQDLTMFVHTKRGFTSTSSLMELAKSVVDLVSRGRRQRIGSGTPVKYQQIWDYNIVHIAMKECRLAGVLTDEALLDLDRLAEMSIIPDMELAEFAVIVPAGYGSSVGVLDAVTVEFSQTLWLATAIATLSTVLVLKFARRQDVSGAVLQALAPMLGQAPPPPAPPRPMLAAWLLACVVLTAAYQGLLLGKLSSAVPRRDLDSLQDLEDSGLPLKAVGNLARTNVLPYNMADITEYISHSEIKAVIDTIATARNCALVVCFDRHIRSYLRPYMIPRRLHVMRLSYSHLNIIALTTKGSPLERPIATAQARAEAAGLLARWRRAEYEREYQDDAKRLGSLRGPRSMTLWHLQPAFVVLGAGHAVAVMAFALEAVYAWRAPC